VSEERVHFLSTFYTLHRLHITQITQNEEAKELHEVWAFCSTLVCTFNLEHMVTALDQDESIERCVELRGFQAPYIANSNYEEFLMVLLRRCLQAKNNRVTPDCKDLSQRRAWLHLRYLLVILQQASAQEAGERGPLLKRVEQARFRTLFFGLESRCVGR
jgi:hypothetical protein